jgi:pimeloyl-ACP methyl ester carboxylesterase
LFGLLSSSEKQEFFNSRLPGGRGDAAKKAAFMADSQVPWGMGAISGAISEPAWRTKPSWYLLTTEDRMIPPDAQRAMSKRAGATVVEVKESHAIYVSQPRAVADLIAQAATKAKASTA